VENFNVTKIYVHSGWRLHSINGPQEAIYQEPLPILLFLSYDVVKIVMNALQKNDVPSKNRGIAVTFNFASSANKNVTGPIERFVNMVSELVCAQMVDHLGAVYEKIKIKGDSASIDVIIKGVSGKFVGFRFLLTKQRDNEFDGTWMTDNVTLIEVISS